MGYTYDSGALIAAERGALLAVALAVPVIATASRFPDVGADHKHAAAIGSNSQLSPGQKDNVLGG